MQTSVVNGLPIRMKRRHDSFEMHHIHAMRIAASPMYCTYIRIVRRVRYILRDTNQYPAHAGSRKSDTAKHTNLRKVA